MDRRCRRGRVLRQNTSYLGLNLPVGVRQQLDKSAVQLGGFIQHDPEEAVLFPPQLIGHRRRGPPRLQVPNERQQSQQHRGGRPIVQQQQHRGWCLDQITQIKLRITILPFSLLAKNMHTASVDLHEN